MKSTGLKALNWGCLPWHLPGNHSRLLTLMPNWWRLCLSPVSLEAVTPGLVRCLSAGCLCSSPVVSRERSVLLLTLSSYSKVILCARLRRPRRPTSLFEWPIFSSKLQNPSSSMANSHFIILIRAAVTTCKKLSTSGFLADNAPS